MSTFGKRLKKMRSRKKITMEELGKQIGVAKSTISGYESDLRQPTLESIQAISRALNTTADYLLGLSDSSAPSAERNAKTFLQSSELHWDGIPLEQEDLAPIRMLLERIVKGRLPKNKKTNDL